MNEQCFYLRKKKNIGLHSRIILLGRSVKTSWSLPFPEVHDVIFQLQIFSSCFRFVSQEASVFSLARFQGATFWSFLVFRIGHFSQGLIYVPLYYFSLNIQVMIGYLNQIKLHRAKPRHSHPLIHWVNFWIMRRHHGNFPTAGERLLVLWAPWDWRVVVTWLLNGSLLMFPSKKYILFTYQNMHRVTWFSWQGPWQYSVRLSRVWLIRATFFSLMYSPRRPRPPVVLPQIQSRNCSVSHTKL